MDDFIPCLDFSFSVFSKALKMVVIFYQYFLKLLITTETLIYASKGHFRNKLYLKVLFF